LSFKPSQCASLIALIDQIGRRNGPLQLYIERKGFNLRVARRAK